MEFSNKALAIFLLAAMVVSLGGTIISLNRLNEVKTVGYATSATGIVQLTISQSLSITTADGNSVDFGSCTPPAGAGVTANVTSDILENTTASCTGYTQTNISVRNDGNVNATVSANSSAVGRANNASGAFLNSSSATSSLQFKSANAGRLTNTGGCTAGTVGAYTPFTEAGRPYIVCDNLKIGNIGGANSIVANFKIVIPNDAPTGVANTTIGFTAVASATP
jgi:hypothetical protein